MSNKPEKTFRIGTESAAVWKNTGTEGGKPFYSVTFERSYRSDDGNFKSADGFNHGDLLNVVQLATRVEAYIAEQAAT